MNDAGLTGAATWTWRPEPSERLRRRVLLTTLILGGMIVGSIAIAVLSPARFSIVVAVMIAGVGVFWLLEHRRFRSTVVEVGADGVLRAGDGKQSASIDLTTVDTIGVRLRQESGQSIALSTPRWTIEIAGPNDAFSYGIAHAAGLFNPDDADIQRLEDGLRAEATRCGARLSAAPAADAGAAPVAPPAPPSMIAALQDPPPGPALTDPPATRFEWRPPVSPKADRRRRWFRIGYIGVALLIAVFGAASVWGDWVGVVLSAVTVPGLILIFCGGIDYAIGRSRRFRIVVDNGVLTVAPGSDERGIALRGAKVSVDKATHLTANANMTHRSVRWHLAVDSADGASLRRMFPSLGTTTTHDDYVALERELRRRT